MPGDPHHCRFNAARCLRLAERARRPELREHLTALAKTWTKLAAEIESDQALHSAILELELGERYAALPQALRLRSYAPHKFGVRFQSERTLSKPSPREITNSSWPGLSRPSTIWHRFIT